MLQFASRILLGALLVSGSAASAQQADKRAWVEMMEVCVTVVTEGSDRVMDEFPAAKTLLDMSPLPMRAVRHPDSPVVASAVSDGSQWLVCLVAGDPAAKVPENWALVGWILGTLAGQIDQPNVYALAPAQPDTLGAILVTCRGKGELTRTIVYETDDREFRIIVTSGPMRRSANPCVKTKKGEDR